jgi:alpha-L-arabinofuranosidase
VSVVGRGELAWLGEVPVIDAIAVLDEESGAVTLFAVNRDQHQPSALDIDLRRFPASSWASMSPSTTRTRTR